MKIKKMLIFIIMAIVFAGCESGFEDMMDDVETVENSVSYNDNGATGGSIPVDNTIYKTGDTVTVLLNSGSLKKIPTAGTGEAFKFGGWNTKADGSGISYIAGSGTFVFDTAIILYAKWVKFELRDRGPANGWIFHDKGSYSGGWRYLEAAPEDISGTYAWKTSATDTPGTSTAIGTGYANTYTYMTGPEHPAAEVVRNAAYGGYTGWFLPSKDELNEMCWVLNSMKWNYPANLSENNPAYGDNRVGDFAGNYWSSYRTHFAEPQAYYQSFGNGYQTVATQHGLYFNVRAVRAF
ncbi:MAG: hypothetical protein CVV49_21665 [Spirochaetae bacterium HGW-Spirochaetae-5]|nr:MAG: hypothetical protein CVV49_21665 [Spirochaetae bacterium HGW-Spirochaetae-5]